MKIYQQTTNDGWNSDRQLIFVINNEEEFRCTTQYTTVQELWWLDISDYARRIL